MTNMTAAPVAAPIPLGAITLEIDDPGTVTRLSIERTASQSGAVLNTVIWVRNSADDIFTLEDRECPLAQDVTYTLTLNRGAAVETYTAGPIQITGTRGCFLTAPSTGECVPVTVGRWDTRTRKARSQYLAVTGRPDPVALFDDAYLWPAGQIVFLTGTAAELDNLTSILTTGIVLLRTQPASSLHSAYFAVGDIAETRLYPVDGERWERSNTVNVQEIAPIPATARISHTSWAQLVKGFATWADVVAHFPTWRGVREWRG